MLIGPELYGSTVATSRDSWFKKSSTPLEILFGAHYALTSDFHIGVGVGPGLTRGYGTPQVRGLLSIAWIPAVEATPPPDRDSDGILDADDACPEVAGVDRRPQDQRVPPSPADRDKDGILDADDACPDVPGVKTDDPKTNGCPSPPDRDKDGISTPTTPAPTCPASRPTTPRPTAARLPARSRQGRHHRHRRRLPRRARDRRTPTRRRTVAPKRASKRARSKILQQVKFKTGSAGHPPRERRHLERGERRFDDHPEISGCASRGTPTTAAARR